MSMRMSFLSGAGLIVIVLAAQAGVVAGSPAAQGGPPAVTVAPGTPAARQAPAVVVPQRDAGPEMTTATFGDWILRCQPISGQAKRSCEIAQSIVLQGQAAPVAQLAFGRTAPNEPLYLTAVVPTNVTFPSVVRISIDERDDRPVDVAWKRCLPAGCFANLAMTEPILARWRGQEGAGRLVFKNGAGQDTQLPISFRGLARALDGLAREEAQGR